MKTLCAVMAGALMLSLPVAASADWYSPPPGTLAGKQSVQFTVSSWLTLSAFQGQMFSYQRFLSDTRAVRVAAGLYLDLNESELDVVYEAGAVSGSADVSSWDHSGTIKVQLMFYRGDGPVRFFWGAGPKVTYTDVHSESVDYSPYGEELSFTYFVTDIDVWGLGLQGFAGVEWFISDMFSLHAEYGVSGMYTLRDEVGQRVYSHDPDSNRRISTKIRSPEFDSDGVRFGLSARF